MLIYICFSHQDRRALLLFCTSSDTTEWRWMHYLVAKDKAQSPENHTAAGRCAEFACQRSLDISNFFFLTVSGGVRVCEFSILIPECNRASPRLENRWGIEARSITPLRTVRDPFTCGWVRAARGRERRRERAWKVFWALVTRLRSRQVDDFLIAPM